MKKKKNGGRRRSGFDVSDNGLGFDFYLGLVSGLGIGFRNGF